MTDSPSPYHGLGGLQLATDRLIVSKWLPDPSRPAWWQIDARFEGGPWLSTRMTEEQMEVLLFALREHPVARFCAEPLKSSYAGWHSIGSRGSSVLVSLCEPVLGPAWLQIDVLQAELGPWLSTRLDPGQTTQLLAYFDAEKRSPAE